MKEYLNCLLNSKVKLGYLHPVIEQAKGVLYSSQESVIPECNINGLASLLTHLTTSLKNNDICQKMDNSRDFLSLVISFENDLNDKIHKLRDVKSTSDHQAVIETCRTIMKAWLQLILMWEKVQTKEINTLASKVKDNVVVVINTKSPDELVTNFQGLCDAILTFKESASVYANQLYDSNSGRLILLFENIARLLSTLSKTAELKFKYQGVMEDPKYMKYMKFCCDSIMFFVVEVTSAFKIPNSNGIEESAALTQSVPEFIEIIDQIRDEVTLKMKPVNLEKLSKDLINLHWFCFKLVPLCNQVLNKRIMESMERLLDFQEEFLKSKECSDGVLDEMETLEKLVNMAILRILLEFSTNSYKEENDIMKNVIFKVKENQNGNLRQYQPEFTQHFKKLRDFIEKLCLVIQIILKCCTFNTAKWWITVCMRRLLFVNDSLLQCLEDYVTDPTNVATIHQLNLVKKEWDMILKVTINNVLTIIDTSEFLKLIDSGIKNILGAMEDEVSNETELEQWKVDTHKVLIYSKISLRVVEAFSMTKLGQNGRKAIKLSSNQVICCIKSVNLYKNTYLEDPKNDEVKRKMFTYLNNLGMEIEKLLVLCNDVKSMDMYNTETGSELDDEAKNEFGISDILNELSIEEMVEKNSFSSALEFVCSIISQNDNGDSEPKGFSSFSLDFVYELSKLSATELNKKEHKLIVQVKTLLKELNSYSGSTQLLNISKDIAHYIIQVLVLEEEYVYLETKNIVKSLHAAIGETNNMRVLIQLSALLSHIKMFEEDEIDEAKSIAKTPCDMNIVVSKTTNLLKRLISMIDEAENAKLIVGNEEGRKNLKRTFRNLGFNTTVGLYSENV